MKKRLPDKCRKICRNTADMNTDFVRLLEESMGVDRAAALVAALDQPPVVSLRLNPEKIKKYDTTQPRETVSAALSWAQQNGLPADAPVAWCRDGVYLSDKPSFTTDPLFHAGAYYVQEASSMAIEKLLEYWQPAGQPRLLDLCASPGGKSTHGISLMQRLEREGKITDFLWVANEVIASRATTLADNLVTWGDPRAVVACNDPADFKDLEDFFDVILVDAPCSGEGMFRKDHAAREEWTADSPAFCAARQRRILEDVWPSLRPGGLLVYSTCTFNALENEENVAFIASQLGANCLLSEHYYPGEQRGEGFFLAILCKDGGAATAPIRLRKSEKRWPLVKEKLSYGWAAMPVVLRNKEGLVKAIPQAWDDAITYLEGRLRVLRSGTAMGRWKGKDWVPEHDYAQSLGFDPVSCPCIELSLEDALTYLRGGAPDLSAYPKGYAVLTYQGFPLGFAKNLGNRCNNLYPAHLRIRKF